MIDSASASDVEGSRSRFRSRRIVGSAVQRARGADERVPQRAALPRRRVDPGHHPVARSIDGLPVAADLLVGGLLLAEG